MMTFKLTIIFVNSQADIKQTLKTGGVTLGRTARRVSEPTVALGFTILSTARTKYLHPLFFFGPPQISGLTNF